MTALTCGQTESQDHTHSADCYTVVGARMLTCQEPQSEEHTHGDGCYTILDDSYLICANGGHIHTDSCYQTKQVEKLTCEIPESEGHTHTEACYAEVRSEQPLCGQEESEGHVHGEECYAVTQRQELICTQEESEEHTHTEECYNNIEEKELICEKEEAEGHTHTDACFTNGEKELICGLEESEGHTHTEACRTVTEEKELVCGMAEGEGAAEHVHNLGCCETVQTLICEKEEIAPQETGDDQPGTEEESSESQPSESEETPETQPSETESIESQPEAEGTDESQEESVEQPKGHVHTDECYAMVLACGKKEHTHVDECYEKTYCGLAAHTHDDECKDEEGNLICGLTEHSHIDNCYKEPHCGIAVHVHTQECTDEEGNVICGMEEHVHQDSCYFERKDFHCQDSIHTHGDECRDEEGNLICGYADFVIHTHDEECYDPNMRLICPLPEIEEHTHTEECWQEGEDGQKTLICEKAEAELHTHGDECRDEEGNLICGKPEITAHQHSETCYEESAEQPEEIPAEVPVQKPVFYCADRIHVHKDSCYDENNNLVCGQADFVVHTHNEECYDDTMKLICPLPEVEEHIHGAECIGEGSQIICGKEQTEVHEHGEDCYDQDGNLICRKTELLRHEHSEDCHKEQTAEVPAEKITYYCLESVHQHTEECYNEEGSLICGEADYVVHTHTEKCYDAEKKLICPLPELEVHVHSQECYPEAAETEETKQSAEPVCGKEEVQLHTHTEECYNEEGSLVCGQPEVEEHVHSDECFIERLEEIIKTFEGNGFVVTAKYSWTAKIPQNAELIAEEITAEKDEAHYAEREAEYQEVMGNKKASMRALLKIGFYVDGTEVEPETPVTITVQFLDENGLEEGSPITVVHFGEEGTEVLDGSDAEDDKTTFEMDSFSELAIGYGKAGDVVTVPVSESIEYSTDAYNIKFNIEGEVTVPVSEIEKKNAENGDGGELPPQEGEGTEGEGSQTDIPEGTEGSAPEDEEPVEGEFVTPIEAEKLKGDLEFKVEPLDEESEEYGAVTAFAEETGVGDEMLLLQIFSYSLTYEGEKLDLSDCLMKVEITPTEALVEYAEEPIGIMSIDGEDTPEQPDQQEIENEVLMMALDLEKENDQVIVKGVQDSVAISRETADIPLNYEVQLTGTTGTVALASSSQANPKFTVQYWATLDIVEKQKPTGNASTDAVSEANKPVVINTDTSQGGKMPVNKDMNLPRWYLSVDESGGQNKIKTISTEVEVYKEKECEFITAPGVVYIDKLAKNQNYKLVNIHVEDKDENGNARVKDYPCCKLICSQTHTHTHTCYENATKVWAFTNKSETQKKYPNDFILITEGAVIKMMYVITTDTPSNGMKFYDYDISDGHLYNSSALNNGRPTGSIVGRTGTTTAKGQQLYMYTDRQGINSMKDQNLAFGNSSSQTRTTLGETLWNGNLLNRANNTAGNVVPGVGTDSFGGCTFQLVSKLSEGKIKYADGVYAPNLFNEGGATGKEEYDGKLYFERSGDTYTLVKTEVTDKKGKTSYRDNLMYFKKIPNWNNTRTIWTNKFYPLDQVDSAGKDGHDLMFGKEGEEASLQSFSGKEFISTNADGKKSNNGYTQKVPTSDDKENHNHYFGMWYTVDFDLTEDYIGPLEYIFYGDDDMWVFLEGTGKKVTEGQNGQSVETEKSIDGQLICDIGGVHSAVGEYVNLWNYIEKGTTGHYRLSFFYTERGASGSTCWMQFTLPSVSFITPKQTTGQIQVEKEVTGARTDEEFGFEIEFFENGNMNTSLKHNFSYEKRRYMVDAEGNILAGSDGEPQTEFVSKDVLIWDGACFTLKANEYILISYVPDGTYFKIEEKGPVIAQKDGDRLKYHDDGTPDWEVLGWDSYSPSITGGTLDSSDPDGRTVIGQINVNKNDPLKNIIKIHYNNIRSFELPETGGSGTNVYTIAGVVVLLGGAGLMYRKKFRERRV